VLVVFSSASNASPQVAREMELAVSHRRPLVPVRVEDAMPTEDMQFFLGVSHWFDAFKGPIEGYLPAITAAAKGVLARQSSPWASLRRRMPTRRPVLLPMIAAVVLVVAILAFETLSSGPPDPMKAMRSPLAGRWQADQCVLDVQDMGQAAYSDGCPPPLTGAAGNLAAIKGGVWAPSLFQQDRDDGTMIFQGGAAHGYVAAWRVRGGKLVTRDGPLGEVTWRRIRADKPLPNPAQDILPRTAAWPIADVPGAASRALSYVRKRWKPDAVLMSIDLELLGPGVGGGNLQTPQGAVDAAFRFYSPETQEGLQFSPGSAAGAMFPLGAVDWDPAHALPAQFLDLPQAVEIARAQGMRGKQVKEAQIENWLPGTSYGRAQLSGVQWMIDSALDERLVVPASTP
jgi:hypothetical protein